MTGARFKRKKVNHQRKNEKVATGVPRPGGKPQIPDKLDDKQNPPVMRGKKCSEFNFLGFAHMGFAPDLIQDLENLGLDMRGMRGSAEATLRMWERCHDKSRKKLSPQGYTKKMIAEVIAGVK